MKYLLQRFLFFGIILFSLASCGGGSSYPKYVAGKKQVLDSIYSSQTDSIRHFIAQLSWLEGNAELTGPLVIADSTTDADQFMPGEDDTRSRVCTDSTLFNVRNTIIVNNRTNLTYFNGEDSLRKVSATNYFITEFNQDSPAEIPIIPDAFIPDYWFYNNFPDYFNTYTDSLYEEEKASFISRTVKNISAMKDVKYLVLLRDKIVLYPRLVNQKTFESGAMLSAVEVYELRTHRLLCKGSLFTISSDEVQHIFAGVNEEIMNKALDMRLIEDFCQQRNIELIRFLNLQR
ncbi:MAG: hypothetical protein NTW29_08555 [Bacteroidetes bacterium]|nr:hypothetical protein [Bacteroidota bacterium]